MAELTYKQKRIAMKVLATTTYFDMGENEQRLNEATIILHKRILAERTGIQDSLSLNPPFKQSSKSNISRCNESMLGVDAINPCVEKANSMLLDCCDSHISHAVVEL